MSNGRLPNPRSHSDNRTWIDRHLAPEEWSGDEARIRCPLPDHKDADPSASANAGKGVWMCHGCGGKGTLGPASEDPGGRAAQVGPHSLGDAGYTVRLP